MITTSKEKLDTKLKLLRDKHVAYTQLLLLLTDIIEDSQRPQILRDITFSVWRMVQNMQRMVEMAVHSTEREIENVSA